MAASDAIESFFGIDERETTLETELLAGLTTFLAMAYVIVVHPTILADAITIEGYDRTQVIQMIAISTILASVVAMVVMGLVANRPFGLAPGMGLNAFFAYTVVLGLGVPWEVALVAVFVEGLVFVGLTLVGAREYVIDLFPDPVKYAVGAGIGIFLLFLGLQYMGVVVADEGTLIALGNLGSNPGAALGVVGTFATLMLYARGVRGSIVIGIVATGLVGWLATIAGLVEPGVLTPDGSYQQFADEGVIGVLTSVQYDITPLFDGFVDGLGMAQSDPLVFLLAVFTFFFVDFFDTAGTLIGVSQIGGFLDEEGNLPEIEKPLLADAVGTTVGAVIGTSTVTTYIESSTGVEVGGRTGLTALVVAGFFLLALLAVPLVAAVPFYASFIAVIVVGIIMLRGVADIDWADSSWAIAGGLTIVMMPLTASISHGIAAGIVSFPLIKTAVGEREDVSIGQWVLAIAFVVYFVAYFVADAGALSF